MDDPQDGQGSYPVPDEEAKSGRISLTIAKCIWAFVLTAVIAYFALYWISWVALYLVLMLLMPLMKFVPIVAAVGVYFGFKGLEAEDERDARLGLALNAVAFIVGAIFFFM